MFNMKNDLDRYQRAVSEATTAEELFEAVDRLCQYLQVPLAQLRGELRARNLRRETQSRLPR